MAMRFKPVDASEIQTGTVRRRAYRLSVDDLATMPDVIRPLEHFYRNLPRRGESARLLAASELLARTALDQKPMLWAVDGTLFKAGLSPLVAQLIRRGLVGCLALNGEAALLDYEIASHGGAWEDVRTGLNDGLHGLARETAEGILDIVNEGVKRGFSIGECLGRGLLERRPPHAAVSMLVHAAARKTVATIHMMLGAEGFHRYPGADGGLLGKGSLKDAHILAHYLLNMPEGSVIVATHQDSAFNQVLLNAYGLARNIKSNMGGFFLLYLGTTPHELDDLPGLQRIYDLNGPLEIMFPLLMGGLFSLVE